MTGGEPDAKELVLRILHVADLLAGSAVSVNLDQQQISDEKTQDPKLGVRSEKQQSDR